MKNYILVFASLLFVLLSCNRKNNELLNPAKDQELLSQYFSAATVGVISSSSNLKYVLIEPVSIELADEDLQKLIKLSPSVPGKVSMDNNTILTFTPDNPLGSNQIYTINIDLKALNSERYKENINYQIKTLMQDMSVIREGLIIDEDGAHTILLNIKTADKTDPEKLSDCVTSDADTKTITEKNNLEYQMALTWKKGIPTGAKIHYDGKPIGSDTKGDIEMLTFNTKKFQVLYNMYDSDKKEYNIYFTQLIQKQIDLLGLLTVNGQPADYTIKNNVLTVFLANVTNKDMVDIYLDSGIKSREGQKLPISRNFNVDIRASVPQIQFVSDGNYFPSDGDFKIPIKTKALQKIRLVVIEIKQENVKQYLAWNSITYSDYYTLRKFGKPIFDEVVMLNKGISDEDGWTVHGIDLSNRVKRNPGSIYHIGMEFSPEYTTLACKDQLSKYEVSPSIPNMDYFKFKDNYYRDYLDYDWKDVENPCKLAFYYDQPIAERLFICSDYSVIAKKAGSSYYIALSMLKDLSVVNNATVTLYNIQGEKIADKPTDSNGFAVFEQIHEDATVVEVKNHNQITYLALDTNESNSLTEFDISGERSEVETEFFPYTDRDVYRPGDSIFVNLMINKSAVDLPTGIPVTMSFYNVDNMVVDKQTQTLNIDNSLIYSFVLKTQPQAKTGVYRCIFSIGPKKIRKNIRIETIKPNTTEVIYSFKNEVSKTIYGDIVSGSIHARYLTGYDLSGAKIKASAKAVKIKQPFTGYANYHFDVYSEPINGNIDLFSLVTDAKGLGTFKSEVSFKTYNSPFKFYIETETTLAEGGVSKEGKTLTVSPFTTYIGASKNEGNGWNGNYTQKDNIAIPIVNLTNKGVLNNQSNVIEFKLQKSIDSWWVDKYRYTSGGNFVTYSSWKDLVDNRITITGKGDIQLGKGKLQDGAYLLTMTDSQSGHKTQVFFTVFDANSTVLGSQPYIVEFETGKEAYKIGEKIEIMLPAIRDAKALISIERGSRVLEQRWVDLSDKKSKIELATQDSWTPNVYIHMTVVQKYMQTDNDLPLRMYGIKYIRMDASKQPLMPVTDLPDALESNKSYTFNISEKEGRPMEYTIAFVDEGLLGLTGFKTPDPNKHFNGKFPLLVKTWDIYQHLISWFNGKFAGIISIGGDDVYNPDAIAEINRFKPVVQHLGPFKLNAKGKNKHTIYMPNYTGKVRMMVVAGSPDNFGNLEKLIPVKNPIMVQSQLPRSLNVTDKLRLPVSVFRDDNSISSFNLTAKTDATMVKGFAASTPLNFSGKDQMTHLYNLEVMNKVGPVKFEIGAQAGNKSMTESTQLMVNYPNAYESEIKKNIIEKGKSLSLTVAPKGYKEVFKSDFIISGIKVPDFTKYADELIKYPYGCLEQITSRGFGMLYLDKILSLEPVQEKERKEQLQRALFEVGKLQQPDGKFKYWENGYYDGWADIYAGNFMIEMKNLNNLGIYSEMLDKWLTTHVSVANNWSLSETSTQYVYENESFIQAFRLYVLAKAGKPAKSGLNRFIVSNQAKNPLTWWLIAGTFKINGYDTKATEFMNKAESLQMEENQEWTTYSFGSQARNLAIIVEVLSYLQPGQKKMDDYYGHMVDVCNSESWISTQTMGFTFIAAYKYFGKALNVNKNVKYTISGLQGSDKSFQHSSFDPKVITLKSNDYNKAIKIVNEGEGQLYVYQNSRFIDNILVKKPTSDGIALKIEYINSTTQSPGLDNISLGDDIMIVVTVENLTPLALTHLALNFKTPSGWELINPRMYETDVIPNNDREINYQDYRDDRVYTFFNLKAGAKKVIRFKAKAAFGGDFFIPAVSCHHMYKGDISATGASSRVKVK